VVGLFHPLGTLDVTLSPDDKYVKSPVNHGDLMAIIKLASIKTDGDTQVRVALDQDVVAQYAEHMRDGDEFPPIVVFHDGSENWLADGFHRFFATQMNAIDAIEADVKEGTLDDARLYAYGANRKRGLHMTSEDNRNIIAKMLNHPVWGKWTNAEISRHVGVSKMTVGRVKQSMEPSESEDTKKLYKDGKGRQSSIETKNLGRKPADVPDNTDSVDELTETIISISQENQLLKDKIAIGQWDASEIEQIDIQEVVADLREQIRVMEIDNKALRDSRDMFQTRNAELMRTVASLTAKLKKLQ